ncbi:hypothetical protein [Streptomyces poriferorum]|uniref:SAV-6107-like HEPN domain-containing protein n=1 Tax=Streptomyces poriferorum TaxID=2798799 RepID=A0ABY9J1B7_9ACTN|nr:MULTISPECIES: hypothetical protein [unclassified Streptomyces]MDP5309421.1 hypothetical protein [Streptomyces sp. Alt4]WLQ61380.1 hypothetical protein P8A19_40875 [Streptomyces sp. Alt2]
MDGYASPYQVFIDVLAHRHAGGHRRALTGELIAAYAELNHLLACTKGTLAGAVWADCGDELERCMSLYRSAWIRFVAMVGDDYPNGVGTVPSPTLGPETTQAFQAAADGLRAALDVLRRESHLLGCESWAR